METKERVFSLEGKVKVLLSLAKERTQEEQAKLFDGAGEIVSTVDVLHEKLGKMYPRKEDYEDTRAEVRSLKDSLSDLREKVEEIAAARINDR